MFTVDMVQFLRKAAEAGFDLEDINDYIEAHLDCADPEPRSVAYYLNDLETFINEVRDL